MKIYSTKIKDTKYNQILDLAFKNEHNALYVDIETTGFSRRHDMIYLIGLLYLKDGDLVLEQYLCEKTSDEYELLYKFNQLVTSFDQLIHFNGDSFDLPFIKERMHLYRLKENLSKLQSLDFLKLLRPYKKVLGTDNLKLKTMEKLAGFSRLDQYSGGELIQLFKEYLDGDKDLETSFILHNEEDMVGLYYLNVFRPLLSLKEIHTIEEAITLTKINHGQFMEINIQMELPNHFYSLNLHRDDYKLSLDDHHLTLVLPLLSGEYKTFFEDYKNYYYLIKEDYAIHESLSSFVQSKFRRKATKHNAYIKKEDTFIKCPMSKVDTLPLLKDLENVYIFNETVNDSFLLIRIDDIHRVIPKILTLLVHNILTQPLV